MESKGKELLPKIQDVIKSLSQQAKPAPTNSHYPTISEPNSAQANVSSVKSELDFDLSLPIDLPGLSSSYSSSTAAIRKSTQTDSKASRPKHRQGDSNTKDARSGGAKLKQSSGDGKGDSVVSKVKEEGKEEAEKDSMANVLAAAKDKEKRIARVKKNREEVKKCVQDKPKEVTKVAGDEGVVQTKDVKAESSKVGGASSSATTASSKDTWEGEDVISNSKNNESLENKPTRRRSARIASFTEDPRKSNNSDGESDDTTSKHLLKQRTSMDKQDTRQHAKKKKKKPSKRRALTRKRANVWSSSSSEESESESARPKSTVSDKAKDGNVASEQKSGARRLVGQKHQLKDDQEVSSTPAKRPRRHSKTSSPVDKGTQGGTDHTGARRRKSKTPQRLHVSRASKSPIKSPPTVTRFNRQVKPNRRYYTSSEEPEEELDSETQGKASGYSSGEDNIWEGN